MDNNIQKENEQPNEEVQVNNAQNGLEQSPKKPFTKWIIAAGAAVVAIVIAAVVIFIPRHDDFTVKVVDEVGNPISSVMVTVTDKKGAQKTKMTDENGLAQFTEVLVGKNTVTLDVSHREIMNLSKLTLINSTYTLEKKARELCAVVRDDTKIMEIYGAVEDNTIAYGVVAGAYEIVTEAGKTSYVVFKPQQPGIYKISFSSTDNDMTIGYYGIPMFVQSSHCGALDYDGKSSFELIIQDPNTPYVIGANSVNGDNCSLIIERIAEAPFDPNYVEWTEVEVDESKLVHCDLNGKTLVDVDIAKNSLDLTLGDDGYYYISGKRVYIRITTPTTYGYNTDDLQFAPVLNGSLALLAGHVDANVGVNLGGHVYDENGNFVAKYKYNEIIGRYMEYVDDEYGVVPLDEQLAQCILLHGESNGWFDPARPGYLFGELDVNDEISWLFLCMVER